MLQAEQVLHDRYQLVRPLGQNAGRQTWLAQDLASETHENIVVKLLAFADQVDWQALKLFEREAEILRNLAHPRIPNYRDYFSIDDRFLWFGLVQDYIPGRSLKDLLDHSRHFSETQLRQMATDVLEVLIYLHQLNPPVFHRDIKPSNLILGENNRIYLVDFGAVQDKAAVEGATFTVVGTYGYASMEQFGGRTVPASDLYALGATLIHLMTGISPADLPQRRMKLQFRQLTSLDTKLLDWIERMVEPDLEERLSTAKQALDSLKSGKLPLLPGQVMPAVQESLKPVKIQRPTNSQVGFTKTDRQLLIRLPGKIWQGVGGGIAGIFILWIALLIVGMGVPLASPPVLIPTGLGIFVIWAGMRAASPTFIEFDRYNFAIYQRLFGGSWKVGGQGDASSTLHDVIQHDMVFHQGKSRQTSRVVTLQTATRDYTFGQGLSKPECIWLVQEIKDWLRRD